MSLVVKEPKRYNSHDPLPNQNAILRNGRLFVRSRVIEPLLDEANHVDSEPHVKPQIETCKLDDSCDGSKPVSSRQTTNKQIKKPPKNEVACPFFKRRGFCLKGANCDFLHPLNSIAYPHKRKEYPHCSNPPICPPA